MKCKPNCGPGRALSKTRLASCSRDTGGIHGKCWRAAPARYWPGTRQDPPARDTQPAGYLAGSTGELLWATQQDALAGCSGGILGGIHWRATLAGELLWRDTWRDPLASYSGMAGSTGGLLSFKIGGIY